MKVDGGWRCVASRGSQFYFVKVVSAISHHIAYRAVPLGLKDSSPSGSLLNLPRRLSLEVPRSGAHQGGKLPSRLDPFTAACRARASPPPNPVVALKDKPALSLT